MGARIKPFLGILLLSMFLSACGMKGPLYLPAPDEQQKAEKK